MLVSTDNKVVQLGDYKVQRGKGSISGLSSGAFMTVQLHLAHSASFCGAGVIAGGPYRCVETFRRSAVLAADAFVANAQYICMSPLLPQIGPDADRLAELARHTADDGLIDPLSHLSGQRLYIFTGSADKVVYSPVVERTKRFYELLGVRPSDIAYVSDVPAGHAILTDNPEDSPLGTNQPPYINQAGYMQSHDILRHIYGDLRPPAPQLSGRLIRFDQTEFFDGASRASMSPFAYAYVPKAVEEGATARVHIALHGCKQGYNYINYVNGKLDIQGAPPYGHRYVTTTGYNAMADANNIIVLYPQAQGTDDGVTQNPDGCWDWWGYSAEDPEHPDYYSRRAIQIRAIARMLARLGG